MSDATQLLQKISTLPSHQSLPADHMATGIPIEPQPCGIVEFFWGLSSSC